MIQTTLKVNGMMCGMCESHINDVVRKTAQVKKVTSSHTKGETVIVSAAGHRSPEGCHRSHRLHGDWRGGKALREKGFLLVFEALRTSGPGRGPAKGGRQR